LSTYSSQPAAPGVTGSPGTPGGPAAPATNTGTAPAEGAPPASGGPFGSPMMSMLIMVLPILLIFMTFRGQNKKQKQIESSVKAGDTVITQSGLIGKITEMVGETRVKVEIAPGVNVRMLKSAITGVDGGESKDVKEGASKDGASKDAKDSKDKPQEKKA
jgi:preprotein translocase subunit YajC